MLDVGVGAERNDGVENRTRCKRPQPAWIQWRKRLEHQHDISKHVQNDIEYEQGDRVLLPVLRSAVDAVFTPLQWAGRMVASVHDPGQVLTQRIGNRDADNEN